ncbi:hypothetical protein JG687_00015152 [Phytophthora cactorum]|uniref:Uncharacterized protein n=1 Tax=Phytophthora cactorum TaxID=29920 RepID=A0A8T1TUH3_9STRA|nr:hypothetical protein JG687_00015152 [Phytophthora cactorum]
MVVKRLYPRTLPTPNQSRRTRRSRTRRSYQRRLCRTLPTNRRVNEENELCDKVVDRRQLAAIVNTKLPMLKCSVQAAYYR